MGMMRIARVAPLSLAKMLGIVYAGIGLLVGAIVSVIAVLGFAAGFAQRGAGSPLFGLLFGAGAVVLLPLFYGLLGLLVGAVAGALYNLAARAVGGIEIDLEPSAPAA